MRALVHAPFAFSLATCGRTGDDNIKTLTTTNAMRPLNSLMRTIIIKCYNNNNLASLLCWWWCKADTWQLLLKLNFQISAHVICPRQLFWSMNCVVVATVIVRCLHDDDNDELQHAYAHMQHVAG